jgi:hypothetical protein
MNLGELKNDLKQSGIQVVGTLRNSPSEDGSQVVVIYFSSDKNIAFPYRPQNIYPLVMKSDSDDEHVNIEKVKAIKRTLIPGWRDPDW